MSTIAPLVVFASLGRREAVDPVAATLVVHALPAQAVRFATRAVCGLRRTSTLPRRGWDGELAGELRTRLKLLPCLLFSPSPINFRTALSVRVRQEVQTVLWKGQLISAAE